MMRWTWLLFPLVAVSCSTVSRVSDSQLTSGTYLSKISETGPTVKGRVYLEVSEDSVTMVAIDSDGTAVGPVQTVRHGQVFHKPSFDIDVLVVLFKYRPGLPSLPSQLTTDFNGNLFIGYRKDWFSLKGTRTPVGSVRNISQRSITLGGFVGIGTTFISPWTTNQQTTDEYNGFIVSKGLSTMFGFKNLTVGVGVGWDHLMDRDKDIWVYQSRPWYGLTLSLNLN